jgi:hypothetical protein
MSEPKEQAPKATAAKPKARKSRAKPNSALSIESLNPAVRSVIAQTRAAAYEALLQEPIRPPRGHEPFATAPLYTTDTVISVIDTLAASAFQASVREIKGALLQRIVHGRKALDIEDVKMVLSRLNLSDSALEKALKSEGLTQPILVMPETFEPPTGGQPTETTANSTR